eukprot:CAMPEP_0172194108 /NCGR_PEP_ID=MMETSP1050-20130122/25371_1 /TAXON_ID=233186 /ORGANISM="Cryptomonas curvata, Strain CCAP979/52" /LENGTH=135 /DNA_ID=CAMNT_0012869827 /DNA_START=71 /DNA_END=474 /DNA_ORIENTATION=-
MHRLWLVILHFSLVCALIKDLHLPARTWSSSVPGDDSLASLTRAPVREVLYKESGPLKVFRHHAGAVLCLCIDRSSGGEILFSGGQDKVVKVWATESAEQVAELAHGGPVLCMCEQRRVLLTGSGDGRLRAFDSG